MTTNQDVLAKSGEYIDYKDTEVSNRRAELVAVVDLPDRQAMAIDIVKNLEKEEDSYNQMVCDEVGELFNKVANAALAEIDKIAHGKAADSTIFQQLIIDP